MLEQHSDTRLAQTEKSRAKQARLDCYSDAQQVSSIP